MKRQSSSSNLQEEAARPPASPRFTLSNNQAPNLEALQFLMRAALASQAMRSEAPQARSSTGGVGGSSREDDSGEGKAAKLANGDSR